MSIRENSDRRRIREEIQKMNGTYSNIKGKEGNGCIKGILIGFILIIILIAIGLAFLVF